MGGILYPDFATKVNILIELCREKGIPIKIMDTVRNKAEQDHLYSIGRGIPGKVVTQVQYPDSFHCWGLAVDFCKAIRGQEYNDDKFFQTVGELAETVGLEWGGRWTKFPDRPHIQYKGFTLTKLKSEYKTPEAFFRSWS